MTGTRCRPSCGNRSGTSSRSAIPDTGCRTAVDRATGGSRRRRVMGAGGARPRVTIVSPHFDDAPLSLGQSLLDGRLSGCRVTREGDLRPDELDPMGASRPRPRPADRCLASGRGDGIAGCASATASAPTRGRSRSCAPATWTPTTSVIRTSTSTTIRWSGPIAHRIRTLRWTTDLVLVPAGIGDHVDHRIVAAAAMRLANEDPAGLAFYEDRPYVTFMDRRARGARSPAPPGADPGRRVRPDHASGPTGGCGGAIRARSTTCSSSRWSWTASEERMNRSGFRPVRPRRGRPTARGVRRGHRRDAA